MDLGDIVICLIKRASFLRKIHVILNSYGNKSNIQTAKFMSTITVCLINGS